LGKRTAKGCGGSRLRASLPRILLWKNNAIGDGTVHRDASEWRAPALTSGHRGGGDGQQPTTSAATNCQE
jgi:hypothetical protein